VKSAQSLYGVLARLASSDTADVAAGNPNVGQFAVAPMGKFLHVAPISLPIPKKSDVRPTCRNHTGNMGSAPIWHNGTYCAAAKLRTHNGIGVINLEITLAIMEIQILGKLTISHA
jgi:hypothetical protein